VADRGLEARLAAQRGKALQTEVATLREDSVVYADVASLLQTFSEREQRVVQQKFEQLLGHGLSLVFGDKFRSFNLNMGIERGQVVLNPTVTFIVDGDIAVTSGIMSAQGGGPSDVMGCLLKILVVLFSAPKGVRPVLFLDETFGHLSREYLPAMASMLRKFVEDMNGGLQVVLITHSPEFAEFADVTHTFALDADKRTIVRTEGA
jgi:hypothetical protein